LWEFNGFPEDKVRKSSATLAFWAFSITTKNAVVTKYASAAFDVQHPITLKLKKGFSL